MQKNEGLMRRSSDHAALNEPTNQGHKTSCPHLSACSIAKICQFTPNWPILYRKLCMWHLDSHRRDNVAMVNITIHNRII